MKKKRNHDCGQLNVKALASALAAFWGAYVLLLGLIQTAWPGARFFWVSREFMAILATLYPGYGPTLLGSFIGAVWALLCGAIGGALIAWLHNYAFKCGR